MKIILTLILSVFLVTSSFSQIKPLRGKAILKEVAIEKNPSVIIKDTINRVQGKPAIMEVAERLVKKTMIFPSNEEIIDNPSPTFKYSVGGQRGSTRTIILTIVRLSADPNWVAEDNILLQEEVVSSLNAETTKKFSNLSLTLNNAYAWNIEFKGERPDEENMDWNVFYYFEKGTSIDKEDPHLCNSKYIINPSFNEKENWKTTDNSLRTSNNMTTVTDGHDDTGAGVIQTPNTIIYQKLQSPIVEGKSYQLKFSLKQEREKTPFRIKAIAFNGALDSLTPSSDIAIMTVSGIIPYFNEWSKITLAAWEAHKDFENIALVFMPEINPRSRNTLTLLIDRVCLNEVKSACEENNMAFETGIAEGDESITITHNEYLVGTVQDLYPNYDTSNAEWYANIADDCLSIGGDDSEEDEIKLNEEDEAKIEEAQLEIIKIEEELISKEPEYFQPKNGIQAIVYNEKDCKCDQTKSVLDPSKPFGGRDIVYLHGLQLAAIKGNLNPSPTFQGKWPQDKRDFYHGGEFNNEARAYWSDHWHRVLGSNTPTNSFIIVSYSANQRLEVAVHAILTQIKDAMEGQVNWNDMSGEHRKSKRCFGSNGIVVITHSTGGLVASTMFGIAQQSNTNPILRKYYGDVRFISDNIDAQIGINAAYGGSPLATAGIGILARLTYNPLMDYAAKVFLGNNNIQQHASFDPFDTILFDLMPSVANNIWRPFMSSSIPTLIMTGTTTGKSAEGPMTMAGNLLIRGFDDGVLATSSQSSHIKKRPGFKVKNRGKLVDKGTKLMKRRALIRMGKSGKSIIERNYYLTPYLSATGMLQGNSVKSVDDNPNQFILNHFPILQTTGDHFDNVNEVRRGYDNDYAYTDGNGLLNITGLQNFTRPSLQIKNNEETAVVFNSSLYSSGLLNPAFGSLNQEWIKNETWGYHLPKFIMISKCIRLFKKERCIELPNLTWVYKEKIIWQRKYHLLKDYETKMGMDYMYQYILR